MSEVVLEQLYCHYGKFAAVKNFNLRIASGEFVTFLGPSGSGKTSVLRMVGGYIPPSAGRVLVDGRDVSRLPPQTRNMGMVFQDYALFPHMRVFDNVGFGLRVRRVPSAERKQRVMEALELVRLTGFESRQPHELSGGQRQRVALARAIVIRPTVLLMDEPLGALDLKLRESMQIEIRRIQRATGITTIYVTHDQGEAFSMSDRIVVMHDGEIVSVGTPEDLYDRPDTRFTAEFVGNATILPVEVICWNGVSGTVKVKGTDLQIEVSGAEPNPDAPLYIGLRPDKAICSSTFQAKSLRGIVVGRRVAPFGTYLEVNAGGVLVNALDRTRQVKEGQEIGVSWEAADVILLPDGALTE